jgi:hypothetical protein
MTALVECSWMKEYVIETARHTPKFGYSYKRKVTRSMGGHKVSGLKTSDE